MLTLETETFVDGIQGREIFDFLANPSDRAYQRWWPGVHLEFHMLSRDTSAPDGHVGDVVLMDEHVGARRVRLAGVVVEADPGKRLSWQLRAGIQLPVWVSLDLADSAHGVRITHRIRAGWAGRGRLFDPVLRLYFSDRFAAAMDAHVHTEFGLLRDRLRAEPRTKGSRASGADAPPTSRGKGAG